MNPVTRAILLREAISTTRLDQEQGEEVIAQRNYAVAPGEYIQEWMQEHDVDRHNVAWQLGVALTYVDQLLAGKIALSDDTCAALEKLTTIPVEQWERLDAMYWKDKARLEHERHSTILDRLAPGDAERVREGIAAAQDGTFQGVKFPEVDEELENR